MFSVSAFEEGFAPRALFRGKRLTKNRLDKEPVRHILDNMEIALDKMTVQQKLQLMEALWTDLSRHEEEVELPAWHGEVLRETGQRVAEGKEKAMDWETAKRQLRERAK